MGAPPLLATTIHFPTGQRYPGVAEKRNVRIHSASTVASKFTGFKSGFYPVDYIVRDILR